METTDLAVFHQAWGRFAAWLAEHSPNDHSELRPPATSEQIAAVEARYGFRLHPELKALLRTHNGVRGLQPSYDLGSFQAGGFLPLGHRLNDTDMMLYMHEVLRDLAEEWADWEQQGYYEEPLEAHAHLWVPFAHPNDGGVLFMDHCPGPTYGHVYEAGLGSGGEPEPWATSLTTFFAAIIHALETKTSFRGSCEPRFFEHSSGARCLDW